MAYSDIAMLSADNDFILRTAACHSTQPDTQENAHTWALEHQWEMAGMPGFGERYASAIVNGIVRPGNDQSVIPDADILSAVQLLLSQAASP